MVHKGAGGFPPPRQGKECPRELDETMAKGRQAVCSSVVPAAAQTRKILLLFKWIATRGR